MDDRRLLELLLLAMVIHLNEEMCDVINLDLEFHTLSLGLGFFFTHRDL